ncbi:MAG TPA: YqhA family protein, partial [Chryseolinea sp.]|nr:YqhA family protein [Chryseolinea sp.]
MFDKLLRFRYMVSIVVLFLLINAFVFLVVGVASCIHGYIDFIKVAFQPTEGARPGLHLLEGLDAFMLSLVFLIFGLGVARLFIFDKQDDARIPPWLNVQDLKGLKVLLWE